MKNFRWTAVAALVAAALVAFVVWDTQRAEKEEAEKEKSQLVLKISQDEVSRIEIIGQGALTKLEKTGDDWRLLSPVEDAADPQAVLSLLDELAGEKSIETVAEGSEIDSKLYGLDQPLYTYKVGGSGSEHEVVIGSVKAFNSNLYAQVPGEKAGEKKVLLVSSAWQSQLAKPVRDLRNKRLYRQTGEFKPEAFEIKLNQPGRAADFKLVKKADGGWEFQGVKSPLPLSDEAVRLFGEDLRDLRAADFVEPDKAAHGALAKHGLEKPAVQIMMKTEGKPSYELRIANAKEGEQSVSAVSSDLKDVLKVMTSAVQRVAKAPEDFFDKKLPFRFDPSQAARLTIHLAAATGKGDGAKGGSAAGAGWAGEFVKSDNDWAPADKGLQNPPSSARLKELVEQLSKLEVARYFAPSGEASAGTLKSPSSIELLNAKGEKLFELIWGEPVTGKLAGGVEQTYHPGRTNKADRAFALAPTSIANLGVEDLKPPPSPTPSPASSPSSAPATGK